MLLEEDVYIAIYLSTQSFFQAKKKDWVADERSWRRKRVSEKEFTKPSNGQSRTIGDAKDMGIKTRPKCHLWLLPSLWWRLNFFLTAVYASTFPADSPTYF